MRLIELPRDSEAPAAARQAIDELGVSTPAGTLQDVRLLVSELVTNSVRHGAGDSIIVLIDAERPGVMRCEIVDGGSGFVPRGREDRVMGGWGLELVDRLARRWGVREGSTHVWFELVTDSGPPS